MDANSSETKDTILFKNAEELLNYNRTEEENMEKVIQTIVDSGVRCVIVGGSVSNTALQYLDHYKIMTIRIMSKFEIRRIAKSIGATMLVRLVNLFIDFREPQHQKKWDTLTEYIPMKLDHTSVLSLKENQMKIN